VARAYLKGLVAAAVTMAAAIVVMAAPLRTGVPPTVFLEDMTWVEVRAALQSGKTGVIIPTAGHEQNGPHMVLGKHRYIVEHTSDRIAEEVKSLLVAPVVAYAPEGDVEPTPSGHMAYAGTISVPPRVFGDILEATARSLRAHGFTDIFLVGDSLDNQAIQAEVAVRLSREWQGSGVRVHQVGDYYAANGQTDWLLREGETLDSIGTHAGIRDTSELLAIRPEGVRADMLDPKWGFNLAPTGNNGQPARASAERGRRLLELKVDAAVRQIRGMLTKSG
jgi:creatinine amidohydrolase/Fe(II)-dependent formamide hydrolase-like protein